jgi:hypothetical protein
MPPHNNEAEDEAWMIKNGRVRESSDTKNRYMTGTFCAALGAASYVFLGASAYAAAFTGFAAGAAHQLFITGYRGN